MSRPSGSGPVRLPDASVVHNGHKWFTSNGSRAAFVTVFAKTDPDAASPHARFSAILVPTDVPGYGIVRAVPTMGHVGGDNREVRRVE